MNRYDIVIIGSGLGSLLCGYILSKEGFSVCIFEKHTKIPGFYFTGQNLNMHGAPGVTIGAVMTCAEILGLEYLFNKIRDVE